MIEVSDRPVLCMSVDMAGDEGVVGVSDHSLYTFNLASGRKTRTLYTTRMGHTEWVTCVVHVPSPGGSKIVSGGMDSKLCLWER